MIMHLIVEIFGMLIVGMMVLQSLDHQDHHCLTVYLIELLDNYMVELHHVQILVMIPMEKHRYHGD